MYTINDCQIGIFRLNQLYDFLNLCCFSIESTSIAYYYTHIENPKKSQHRKRRHRNRSEIEVTRNRIKTIINYLRRKLAILEVEQGEWGTRKAKDIPVGQAREKILDQILC